MHAGLLVSLKILLMVPPKLNIPIMSSFSLWTMVISPPPPLPPSQSSVGCNLNFACLYPKLYCLQSAFYFQSTVLSVLAVCTCN